MISKSKNSDVRRFLDEEGGQFATVTPICAINPVALAYMQDSILNNSMKYAEYVEELGEHIVTISPARAGEEQLGSSYLLYVKGKQKIFHYHPLDINSDDPGRPRAAHRRLTFTPVGGDAELVFFLGEDEHSPISTRYEIFILKEGAAYEVVFGGKEQRGHLVHAFGSTKDSGVIIFESVHRADSVAGGVDALTRQSVVYKGKLPKNEVSYKISPPETNPIDMTKLKEYIKTIVDEKHISEIQALFDALAPTRMNIGHLDMFEARGQLPVYDIELEGERNKFADHFQRPNDSKEYIEKILGLTGEKSVPFLRR